MSKSRHIFHALFVVFFLNGCASFYQLNYEFNRNFEDGNISEAARVLDQNKKAARSKTRFLYYANHGVVDHLLGNYQESNDWLEKAYLFGEDYRKNYVNFAASYFLNPNLIVYPGEDHEHLILLYYKSLNFLKMGDFESALVECRRLNQRLYELGDKYQSESKFQRDAFIHNLIGIIYDAAGDYNNAFIAYRNSLEIYQGEYTEMFEIAAPEQLKKDLLRTASLAGFPEELDKFSEELGMSYSAQPMAAGGELVFFWHNGLAPVKDEWSINFVAVRGSGGQVIFENEEFGLSFPFYYDLGDDGNASLSDLTGTRVAFPKYIERPPFFQQASLEIENYHYPLEIAEDINAIAFRTLRERMLEELGKGLLRVALKKTIENQVRKEDDKLGFLIGVVNFASEQADTRNWQTIPHSIHYSRVPLKVGENKVNLYTEGPRGAEIQTFTFEGANGKTQFQTYQSLESDIAF